VRVLVGMIASGKSTYAREAARRQGAVIVNDDAIVQAVHGGDYSLYDKALKPLYKSVENHIAAVAVALGRDVVVDRGTNVSSAARRRWLGLASSLDCWAEAVVFGNAGPATHAGRRCEDDPRGHDYDYWLRVATAHDARWEPPVASEGWGVVSYYRSGGPLP
jgi:predicted kinase